MEYLAAVVLFPLLLWGLSLGVGLLLERLTGAALPGPLVMPVGFAGLIVSSDLMTWFAALAPLTPFLLLVLAGSGFALATPALAQRWSSRRHGWWWTFLPALATYLIVAAPEIAAGRPTFSGYLLDTTGAVQLMGAEHLLQHGHAIVGSPSSYWATLGAYFGNGYPTGGHSVLAAVGWLSCQNLIWLLSGFQALELGMLAMVLSQVARYAGLSRAPAAITGVIASVPALVYAYALMGSIKELTALPAIALMGALMIGARQLRRAVGLRAAVPFAVAAAATLDAIGLAGSAWVVLFTAGALLVALRPLALRDVRPLIAGGVTLVVAVTVLALPVVGPLSSSLNLAKNVTNANSAAVHDPGNLLRPLKFLQVFGVWLGESHRVEPRYLNQTYLLLGMMVICVALGVAWLLNRRAWAVLGFVALSLAAYLILHPRATEWTSAKLLVILSPVVVLVGLLGAFGVMRRRPLEGTLLAIAVASGVLISDALLYHGTNLAPTARYQELADLGSRYAGQGPTLIPDFDEYAVYDLRSTGIDGPGLVYSGPFAFIDSVPKLYGHSYDLDQLQLATVERFRTIVMRRSPGWSRPPSNYRLVQQGRYYAVWQRGAALPRAHFDVGGGWQPAQPPSCREVREVARDATRLGASIVFSPRPENISLDLTTFAHTALVGAATDLEGRPELFFGGPARVESGFRVSTPGSYEVWLGGSVDRPLRVELDGRLVGAPSQQSGGDGSAIYVGRVALSRGSHTLRILRGGGSLRPDDNGSAVIDGFVLQPVGAEASGVQSLPPSAWRSLCGRSIDWLEVS